jgi:guanylate kinase
MEVETGKEGCCGLILLVGHSGSGKSTIEDILTTMGFEKVISYTSRPPRMYEQNNCHYHFISPEEFQQRKADGFFVECTCYRDWFYGVAKEDCLPGRILTLDPFGCEQILWQFDDVTVVYVKASEETRRERLILRGDHLTEIARRISSDRELFADVDKLCHFTLDNDMQDIEGLPKRVEQFVNTYLRR